jgi:uncharacterized protein (TIGR02246 family)
LSDYRHGNGSHPQEVEMMNEEQLLEQVVENYQRYVSNGDIQGYMGLFCENVVWMPPGAIDRGGKSEVLKAESGAFAKFKFDFTMTPIEVKLLSDNCGMVICSSQGKMTPLGGGEDVNFLYRVFILMKKQPDGGWLISRQIWNQKPLEGESKAGNPW